MQAVGDLRTASKGAVVVRFEYLQWNIYQKITKKKEPNAKNVERLKSIFQKSGCDRFTKDHHIIAIFDHQDIEFALKDARERTKWDGKDLPSIDAVRNSRDGYPELRFPNGLECLQGRDRIQAGKEWLTAIDKWWVVDLYPSDSNLIFKTLLVEQYLNEEKTSDGEIYRRIREYDILSGSGGGEIPSTTYKILERGWWSRLPVSRQQKLKSLFTLGISKDASHPNIAAAFDNLRKITGLCDAGMMISTLHKVLATHCDEEIASYLKNIRGAWVGFVGSDEDRLSRIDIRTVKGMEARAPGRSTKDSEGLCGLVLGCNLFGDFNPDERQEIWCKIQAFKGIVLSLFTFFQDIHLLQDCAHGMKQLLRLPPGQTIFGGLKECFEIDRDSQWIEYAENKFTREKGTAEECFKLGILGLWTFALRHNRHLCKPDVLQRLAMLADKLGFSSPEINTLKEGSPVAKGTEKPPPLIVTTGPGEQQKQRYGRITARRRKSFDKDKDCIFLYNLCEDDNSVGEGITSFFVLKSWFKAFFDPPSLIRPKVFVEDDYSIQPTSQEDVMIVDMESTTEKGADYDMGEGDGMVLPTQQDMSQRAAEENERLEQEISQQTDPTGVLTPREVVSITFKWGDLSGFQRSVIPNIQKDPIKIEVLFGDPNHEIEQRVETFSQAGYVACTALGKPILASDCYKTAVESEQRYTLTLVPKDDTEDPDVEEFLQEYMELEQSNANNALIFGEATITIYYKEIILTKEDDWSKPVIELTVKPISFSEVPEGDPDGVVLQTVDGLYYERQMKPFSRMLKHLSREDCYQSAIEDEDNTLFFVMTKQEDSNAKTHTLPQPQLELEKLAPEQVNVGLPSHPNPISQVNFNFAMNESEMERSLQLSSDQLIPRQLDTIPNLPIVAEANHLQDRWIDSDDDMFDTTGPLDKRTKIDVFKGKGKQKVQEEEVRIRKTNQPKLHRQIQSVAEMEKDKPSKDREEVVSHDEAYNFDDIE